MLVLSAAASVLADRTETPPALGLDHIPVVVSDVELAAETFRRLGFALKPGRFHANGIRNAHIKFPDGSGIELLTAPKAVDDLSSHYVKLLRVGEGAAFVSFHERNTERLHTALRQGRHEFRQNGPITALRSPDLAWIFVVPDNRSPTDRPEHFAHTNGASAMRAVWLAPDDREAVIRLLVHLGGRQQRRQVLAPGPVDARVVTLAAGEVVIVPPRHQLLSGRPVIGASFTVTDLARVRQMLARARITPWSGSAATQIVVEPASAHGLWLEFVEDR